MGRWDERFSNEYYLSIATAFDMENHGSKDYKLLGGSNYDISA